MSATTEVGMAGGKTKWFTRARMGVAAVLCAFALVCVGVVGYAIEFSPNYAWYTGHDGTAEDPYVLNNPGQFLAFAALVNGTADVDGDGTVEPADSFSGKQVQLGADINFRNTAVTPAGGMDGKTFDGTFDGQGHSISAFNLAPAEGQVSAVGLIGAAGANSTITNVTTAANANLTVTLGTDVQQTISNVGVLVGYSEGSVTHCTNNAALTVTSDADGTEDEMFRVKNVGGVAGIVKGDVTDCANAGKVLITETGTAANDVETDVVINVGGVVGCAGDMDTSVDAQSAQVHGQVSDCTNSGTVYIVTPTEIGDGTYSKIYAMGDYIGGVVGYSRGNVLDCSNSGYVGGEHVENAGGVIGNLRAAFVANMPGSSTRENDDGTADEVLLLQGCSNTGNVAGYVCIGGVAGRVGTYCEVRGCMDGDPDQTDASAQNWVVATRANKPHPSGIVATSYSDVSFCLNYANIASASWDFENQKFISLQSGYYTSGICGALYCYTDSLGRVTTYHPKCYSCLNVGTVNAIDNMRQRTIVGNSEEGYVQDNFSATGLCYKDTMSFENTIGVNLALSPSRIMQNDVIAATDASIIDSTGELKTVDSSYVGKSVIEVLNSHADANGWAVYWNASDGTTYPSLNLFGGQGDNDIAAGVATQTKAAPYTGLAGSVPTFTVQLGGQTLTQGVDFRVVADPTAVAMSEDQPYTATLMGIGRYQGTLKAAYDIGKLDLSTCTVTIDSVEFDYEPHTPTADTITVTNAIGTVVDPSTYTFAFGTESTEWKDAAAVDGAPVNAGTYDVVISAAEDSDLVEGSVTGNFAIQKTSLVYSIDNKNNHPEKFEKSAHATTVCAGTVYEHEWQSFRALTASGTEKEEIAVTFPYTGHVILPTVTFLYRGHQANILYNAKGAVYRLVTTEFGEQDYSNTLTVTVGGSELSGTDTTYDNIGSPTEKTEGGIIVKARTGDNSNLANYTSYDAMKFYIDPSIKANLGDAAVSLEADSFAYEEGCVYEPTVDVEVLGSKLDAGTDYTVTYTDNDKPGTATYTVTPGTNGIFEGSYTGTFEITATDPYALTYDYDDETATATVTGVNYYSVKDSFDVVIPATVEKDGKTYTVTAIGDNAFKSDSSATNDASKIANVTIPATVQTIGTTAFGCTSTKCARLLQSVTFADIERSQLTTIGDSAFMGCNKLTSFTFPARVTTIGAKAFYMATTNALTDLTFLTRSATRPGSVSTSMAFSNVGYSGTVTVHGYETATAVQTLVTNNSATKAGTNGGRRFVFEALPTPEEYRILTQPADAEALAGATATFSVETDDVDATYQWQESADAGTTWTNVSGATDPDMTIDVTDEIDGYQYRCVLAYSDGATATSGSATLTVLAPDPTVTVVNPQALGGKALVTVTVPGADASADVVFWWQYSTDGGRTWVVSAETLKASRLITVSTAALERQWRVMVVADGQKSVATFELGIG